MAVCLLVTHMQSGVPGADSLAHMQSGVPGADGLKPMTRHRKPVRRVGPPTVDRPRRVPNRGSTGFFMELEAFLWQQRFISD